MYKIDIIMLIKEIPELPKNDLFFKLKNRHTARHREIKISIL